MTPTRSTLARLAVAAALVGGPLTVPHGATASDPPASASSSSASPAGLRRTLQRDARALVRAGAPGVLAEARVGDRRIVVRSGVGDLRTRTPIPWRAHFRIASFTKPFVAATVLQLVGEGRLSLDDTVDRWLPGLVRGHGNDGRDITVRQLLQHTSGLPDYTAGFTWLTDRRQFLEHRYDTVTARGAVRLAMRQPPEFAPGSSWRYSNTNYALAGLVIRAVTGHGWRQQVRQRILRPLHLRHTSIPTTGAGIPRPHARAYERFLVPGSDPEDLRFGRRTDVTRLNPSWGGAAGAIISTTADANRFLRALVRGRILAPAQLREMQTTVPTDAGFQAAWPGSRYGLGLLWVPNRCGGMWSHGGDITGFLTRNGVSPDGRRSVVVSLNTDSPVPARGKPDFTPDIGSRLIGHALCGRR